MNFKIGEYYTCSKNLYADYYAGYYNQIIFKKDEKYKLDEIRSENNDYKLSFESECCIHYVISYKNNKNWLQYFSNRKEKIERLLNEV